MILPSDSDPPDDRDKSKPDPESATPWWESADSQEMEDIINKFADGLPKWIDPANDGMDNDDDESEDDDTDGEAWKDSGDEEDADFDGDPNQPALQSVAGPGWQKDLYKDLMESLREIAAIEDPDDEFNPPEPPDLFTFFGELAALRNELRHQAQRDQDLFQQIKKSLHTLTRSTAKSGQSTPALTESAWSAESCLALISACDLLPQSTSPEAYAASMAPLLKAAGLTPIAAPGQPFEPATMTVSGQESAAGQTPGLVLRVLTTGYLRDDTLLRPAAVIVAA